MTPRQQDILNLFHEYRRDNSMSPTLEELSDLTAKKWGKGQQLSKTAIHDHLEALIASGHLVRTAKNKSRCIQPARRVRIDLNDVLAVIDDVVGRDEGFKSLLSKLKARIGKLPTEA